MTPAGIEPATFRSVAQHSNHCATAVPQSLEVVKFLPDRIRQRFHSSYIKRYSEDRDYKDGYGAQHSGGIRFIQK